MKKMTLFSKPSLGLALGLSLLCASCGKEIERVKKETVQEMESLLGDIRLSTNSDHLSANEVSILKTVCADLERMYGEFKSFDSLNKKLQYKSSTRSCGSETSVAQEAFLTYVREASSGRLTYEELNGATSPFEYVITHKDEAMGRVCAHVAAVPDGSTGVSRLLSSGEYDPIWISAYGEESSNCPVDSNCVFLETASSVNNSDSRFRVRDVEFISVNNGDSNSLLRGFVLSRKQINSCSQVTEGESNTDEEDASKQSYLREMDFIGVID